MVDQSCNCLVCVDDYSTQDAFLAEGAVLNGFTPMVVMTHFPFAYTIGLWHSFRWPEVVMFGLEPKTMGGWLNTYVEMAKKDGPKPEAQDFDGVLRGFPTQLRTVHPSWNDALFGTLYRFYGSFPHVQQLVWPDRNGVWPWQEGVTRSCQLRQAQAWLPVSEHPKGCWRLIGTMSPGFPLKCGPDCEVLTTRAVLGGTRKLATVVNDGEGLDILDERGYNADDFIFAYIGDIVDGNPQLKALDDSREAQRAVIGADGQWSYRHISAYDRKNSKRAWDAVIAEENASLQ